MPTATADTTLLRRAISLRHSALALGRRVTRQVTDALPDPKAIIGTFMGPDKVAPFTRKAGTDLVGDLWVLADKLRRDGDAKAHNIGADATLAAVGVTRYGTTLDEKYGEAGTVYRVFDRAAVERMLDVSLPEGPIRDHGDTAPIRKHVESTLYDAICALVDAPTDYSPPTPHDCSGRWCHSPADVRVQRSRVLVRWGVYMDI